MKRRIWFCDILLPLQNNYGKSQNITEYAADKHVFPPFYIFSVTTEKKRNEMK